MCEPSDLPTKPTICAGSKSELSDYRHSDISNLTRSTLHNVQELLVLLGLAESLLCIGLECFGRSASCCRKLYLQEESIVHHSQDKEGHQGQSYTRMDSINLDSNKRRFASTHYLEDDIVPGSDQAVALAGRSGWYFPLACPASSCLRSILSYLYLT